MASEDIAYDKGQNAQHDGYTLKNKYKNIFYIEKGLLLLYSRNLKPTKCKIKQKK